MNHSEILSTLKIDLSIASRKKAKNDILDANISAKELLSFISNTDERNQVLFICVLDYIIEDQPKYLDNSITEFISFQQQTKNETCKRTTSRIVYNLLENNHTIFSNQQKDILINIHFDWLISKSSVATRVNCLSVLFELRNEAEWITTELLAVIDHQMQLQEPSFVSRAKKILIKIRKQNKKINI